MAIYDLFSKRKRRAERGDAPDVYQYDTIPTQLRIQVIHLWKQGFGDYHRETSYAYFSFKRIHDVLCREYGQFRLTDANEPDAYFEAQCRGFLLRCEPDRALDTIELSFNLLWTDAQKNNNIGMLNAKGAGNLIAELNVRFKESGVGYQFESGQLIRIDSTYIHAEAVKPALRLLGEEGFEGADEEFRSAFEHHRHGSHKETLVDALKAFESTMKTICKRKGWDFPEGAAARNLITIIFEKGLIHQSLQTHFSGVRQTLEAGVPTVRNKLGGHGQGEDPIEVPSYLASYALHLTATNIVMLVEAFKASR